MKATADQIAQLSAASRTTYEKSAWLAVLTRVAESGESEIKLESDFPGVKPAHVQHMLRLTLKADENAELRDLVVVGKHKDHGVFVKYIGETDAS